MKSKHLSKFAKKNVKKARKARAAKKPTARRAVARPLGLRRSVKTVIRQSLGSATENKLTLSAKPDTRAKMMKAVGTPSFWNKSYPFTISNNASGLQAWGAIPYAPQSELQAINTAIGLANGIQGVSPNRFLLENLNMTYEFQNRSTSPAILRVYVIKPKRDTWYTSQVGTGTGSMVYVGANLTSFPWGGDPLTAIQQGYNAQINAASGSGAFFNLAVAPTSSDLFNEYYHIEREVEINMAQGGVHRLEVNQHYDKVLDANVFGNTPLTALRGITGYLLFRAEGAPVQDATEGSANLGATTTAPVYIGCIHTRRYRFTQIFSPVIASSDATTVATSTLDSYNIVNPGSGAVTSVAQT